MRLPLIVILFTLMIGVCDGLAKAPNKVKLSLNLTYRGYYDNNLLRYSPRDRGRYLDRAEINPSPLRSLDDWRSDFKVSSAYNFNALNERDTELQATFNFGQHSSNPVKNLGWLSFSGQQEISKKWTAALNYFFEPRFYLRDYRDRHTNEFKHCEFTLAQWTERAIFSPLNWTELTFTGRQKKYYYNKYFTEYDGAAWTYGLEQSIHNDFWRVSGGWFFTRFENTGFDSLDRNPFGIDLQNSEFGEGDYVDDEFQVSLQHKTKFLARTLRTTANLSLTRRYFTTDLPPESDRLHSGRKDITKSVELSGKINLDRTVAVSVGWDYETRKSQATYPLANDLKTYYQWGSWMEINYRLR